MSQIKKQFFSCSSTETFDLGQKLGEQLTVPTIYALFGELGAGKTTFIKGLVQGATHIDASLIQSPTYTYLNIYEGPKTVFHFDLYRLHDLDEFLSLGFEEYFDAEGICCIEWSERIAAILPLRAYQVHLEHRDHDQRLITISHFEEQNHYVKG